jgi:thymidylate kinase
MKIFVLEGVNAAGKSLAGTLMRNAMHELGLQCLVVDPAAFGPIGKLLRERIVDPSFGHNADLDSVLFAALRAEGAEHILQTLRSASCAVLVLERWSLALAAYGAVDGTRPQLISELRAVLDGLLEVDFTFLLNIDGETACRRLATTEKRNRFEMRGEEYLGSVAQAYRNAAQQDKRVSMIDASATPAQVCFQLRTVLRSIDPAFEHLNFSSSSLMNDPAQMNLRL